MGRDHRFSISACHGDSVSHFVASVLSVFVPPGSRVGLLASFRVPKFPKTFPRCPLSMSLTLPVVLRRGVLRSIGGPCPDALSFFPRIRRSDRSSRMYGNPIECFGTGQLRLPWEYPCVCEPAGSSSSSEEVTRLTFKVALQLHLVTPFSIPLDYQNTEALARVSAHTGSLQSCAHDSRI